MKFITHEEFKELLRADSYWAGRWGYTKVVVEILERENIQSALEIGAKELQVVKDSDVMDNGDNPCRYSWDAGVSPWPIKDKQYDVVIALQVWEHLRENQQTAFKEVMRTSKMAILSFPHNWDCPNDPMHHGKDYEVFKEWTCGVVPKKIFHIPSSGGKRDRIIYFFKF